MRDMRRWMDATDEEQADANRQTASLAGMAFALFLVVVGVFLVRELHTKAVVEDCLLAQRLNCDAMVQPGPAP
jgi:hypothetical protein